MITTKEKVIRESISRIEKRLVKIDDVLNANYLSDIVEVRKEAQTLLEKYRNDFLNKDFQKRMCELSGKEKELHRKFNYQNKNSIKLIKEKVKLELELGNLKTELYWIEERKNRGNNGS